jgi:hypothetical protein
MAAVLQVGIVNGVPTIGTGEVMTLDVIAAKLDTCITALQIIDNMVLAAGTNNIGDVDVLTLPALPAGTNNIGDVDVLSLPALPAGTNAIGKLAANAGVNIGEVSIAAASQNANGRASAANSGPTVMATEDFAAVGALGETAPASDTASSGLNGRLQRIAQRLTSLIALFGPQTTGGLDTYFNADLDQVAVAVKASAGGLFNGAITNRTTAPLYLHFWNVAQGSVVVGTTAVKFTIEIPANATDHTLALPNWNPHGVAFTTAITAAVTTNFDGTGSPATNACIATFFIK